MIAKPMTWRDVKINMHVRDPHGVTWKVGAINETHVGLEDRDGKQIVIAKPAPTDPVDIFLLTPAELEAQIRDQLGGTTVAIKREEDSIFICRAFDGLRAIEMISHMKLMHRVHVGDTGAKTPAQIRKIHDEVHSQPSHKWVPHIHEDRLNRPSPFNQEV